MLAGALLSKGLLHPEVGVHVSAEPINAHCGNGLSCREEGHPPDLVGGSITPLCYSLAAPASFFLAGWEAMELTHLAGGLCLPAGWWPQPFAW